MFVQYQYCQNFLNKKEFPEGSPEHSLGKLMMLYPKLCDWMIDTAKKQNEGIEIYNFEGNYDKAVTEAIKYVEKSPELTNLYNNFWSDSTTINTEEEIIEVKE